MAKKPRNKKRDHNKVTKIINRMVLKNKIVTYITGDDFNNLYCLQKNKKVSASLDMAKALANQPFKWSVLIAVFCRDQNGQEYIKSELIASKQKYLQHELIQFLSAEHTALIKSVNGNHVIGAGWLASPEGIDWDEKVAGKIFEQLGAFEWAKDQDTGNIYQLPVEDSA
jgi:hypothetical protein